MEDKKIKRQNIYKVIMLVVLTATIVFMLTTFMMFNIFESVYKNSDRDISATVDSNSMIKTLQSFKAMLNEKYIGEINDEKLLEGAIKGYIDGLDDPYTEYLTKEEMEAFTEETNAEYVGIGVYISNDRSNNTLLIVGVMKNSPALEAGMQAGDIVEKIDGEAYLGEQLNEATSVLKGKEGTNVKVTVLRDGKEIDLDITRKKITVDHVASKMLDNQIAYIQIDSFDSGVKKTFEEQITQLKNDGAKGIIIDLRSNGGGIVDEATGIAELFVKKGETILITKGKTEEEEITKSTKNPIIKDIPVVILVNEGTASASEILAGALKDQYGAKIVGKTTYGKGVIQTLYTLSDGSGLKITTDEYYTPKHNKIHKVGIKPDIEVDLTKDAEGYYETSEDKDAQLQRAIQELK